MAMYGNYLPMDNHRRQYSRATLNGMDSPPILWNPPIVLDSDNKIIQPSSWAGVLVPGTIISMDVSFAAHTFRDINHDLVIEKIMLHQAPFDPDETNSKRTRTDA